MATADIKYRLNAQLADNTVTVDNKGDKIAIVVSAGTADKQRLISVMEVNPGLERETVEAVINFEQRVLKKLILTGFRVNTGLYSVAAKLTGVVEGNVWNPEKNGIYASFTQGADLRETIGQTSVNIIGKKCSAMYVAGGEDAATRALGFTATAGRPYTLPGAKLKLAGIAPSVGITLTSQSGIVPHVTDEMIAVNTPAKLVFIIPSRLADGAYELKVTTQFNVSGLLKAPRSVTQTLYIGQNSGALRTVMAMSMKIHWADTYKANFEQRGCLMLSRLAAQH